jgi:glutaminyl-peptide cyclotransferase
MDARSQRSPTTPHGATRSPVAIGLAALVVLALVGFGWLAVQAHVAAPSPSADLTSANQSPSTGPASAAVQPESEPVTERLRVEVIGVAPHDREAFTQGLLWHEGTLYESTGLHGRSSLRQVDRATGEVRRLVHLDPTLFAEGLARVGNRLIQITWKEGVALVYDLQTLERVDQLNYSGEGWGLCYDGERLIMTDGSSNLTMRDPQTFSPTGSIAVMLEGRPIDRLNELECVGNRVYANVWMTDMILRIDPRSGRVEAVIDASNLLSPEERRTADVLNGIAYDPEREVFLITGKLWPKLFEVRFVPPPS